MSQFDTSARRTTESGPEAQRTVSVIVLVNERTESLVELYEEYSAALGSAGLEHEFVFVAQPWFSKSLEPLRALARKEPAIRVGKLAQPAPEATLVKVGASMARGSVLVTLPSYRRVDASALPGLVEQVDAGADMVLARRAPRRDSWINRMQSRMFHALLGWFSGERLQDVGCGVRAMRSDLLDEIDVYGDFYRFLPLFAIREGFRVEELACAQHPNDRRRRIYSPGVYLRRLIDLLGLYFLLRFTDKPLRFFGLVGGVLCLAGGGTLLVLLVQRLYGFGIANRPLLLLGVVLLVLGTQAIALGLIGEIIVHLHASRRRGYRLRASGASTEQLARRDHGPE